MRLEDAQAILRLRSAEGHHRVLWGQYALRTWLEKLLPLDNRHLAQNRLGGAPCPRFLQWDPDRRKYRKRKGGVPPPSFGGGGGGGSPGPGGDDDGSIDNSSSATSQVTRSAKSGRNALTRKKEATEVRFDTLCEPRYWRRYKRKCKKLLANDSGYPG